MTLPWGLSHIQRCYFRVGPYTNLWIMYVGTKLDWVFTYRDLGMDHTVKGHFDIAPSPDGWVVDHRDEDPLSDEAMLERVFDHFRPCELYTSLGIDA